MKTILLAAILIGCSGQKSHLASDTDDSYIQEIESVFLGYNMDVVRHHDGLSEARSWSSLSEAIAFLDSPAGKTLKVRAQLMKDFYGVSPMNVFGHLSSDSYYFRGDSKNRDLRFAQYKNFYHSDKSRKDYVKEKTGWRRPLADNWQFRNYDEDLKDFHEDRFEHFNGWMGGGIQDFPRTRSLFYQADGSWNAACALNLIDMFRYVLADQKELKTLLLMIINDPHTHICGNKIDALNAGLGFWSGRFWIDEIRTIILTHLQLKKYFERTTGAHVSVDRDYLIRLEDGYAAALIRDKGEFDQLAEWVAKRENIGSVHLMEFSEVDSRWLKGDPKHRYSIGSFVGSSGGSVFILESEQKSNPVPFLKDIYTDSLDWQNDISAFNRKLGFR